MTPQSMFKKMFWIGLISWMFSGTAKAQCIHEAAGAGGNGGSFTLLPTPTQGDFLVFGLTVLILWGFSAWMMNQFFPYGAALGSAKADMKNAELTGLQVKTDEALQRVEEEYEEMILSRMGQVENNKASQQEAKEIRSQRAASV